MQQAIDKAPPKEAKPLYLLYADYEERFGMIRHTMAIYGAYIFPGILKSYNGLSLAWDSPSAGFFASSE